MLMVISPLMVEHRLIERMIKIIGAELDIAKSTGLMDPVKIDSFVEFMRMYADKIHHGKEEAILCKEIEKKNISIVHKAKVVEIVGEHIYGRSLVDRVVDAANKYKAGQNERLADIIFTFSEIAIFYTRHIDKEDKHLFVELMRYFDFTEHDRMVKASQAYDAKYDLERYNRMVSFYEKEIKK